MLLRVKFVNKYLHFGHLRDLAGGNVPRRARSGRREFIIGVEIAEIALTLNGAGRKTLRRAADRKGRGARCSLTL